MIEEAELASILNLSAHDSPTHLSQSILAMKTARGPGHFKIAIVEFCKSNEFPFSVKDGIPLRNGYPLRNAIHLVHLPHEPQLRQQPHSFLKPGTLMHSELWRSYSVNLTQYKYKKKQFRVAKIVHSWFNLGTDCPVTKLFASLFASGWCAQACWRARHCVGHEDLHCEPLQRRGQLPKS